MAEGAQPGAIVGRHLDLVVGPDDEFLQQQVGHVGGGDVHDLVVTGQTREPVPRGSTWSRRRALEYRVWKWIYAGPIGLRVMCVSVCSVYVSILDVGVGVFVGVSESVFCMCVCVWVCVWSVFV